MAKDPDIANPRYEKQRHTAESEGGLGRLPTTE